ncbi:thermonuclease family protein [Tropicibacter oceani]|uniref:Thermonuclease family protein n=1 Tax=Tropicibacter oceani TaxID=3058420 RepID=A0ABY8QCL2_9RHOB|nr:thermonuclease family protein [Tropicibacter oceani]WGW02295.1 thermonuclease family protein [Tropicibacter oceani]
MLLSQPALADVAGKIRVIDGDTIEIAGTRLRLHGIDAPESDQMCGGEGAPMWPCGSWASGEVRARYNDRIAHCEALDMDRYGRTVARCVVDGQDMGQALVQGGLAFAYLKYSVDYAADERDAAQAGRGLHAVGVQSPDAFRTASRRAHQLWNARGGPEDCTIKGNISQKDQRIYHVPGQRWYADTRINTDAGERWFCTEAEARAAGWRRAHQ